MIIIIFFNEMNNHYYDLPLQTFVKRKLASSNHKGAFENNKELIIHESNQLYQQYQAKQYRYDLPRQRNNDEFYQAKSVQNRPLKLRNVYNQMSVYTQQTNRMNDIQVHNVALNNKTIQDNARQKVTSIYQRLLQQSKLTNKKQKNQSQIIAQTTFKPKQLHRQIVRHNSAKILNSRRQDFCHDSSLKKSKINEQQNKTNVSKKINFNNFQNKTKYQRILQQHFPSQSNRKKSSNQINSEQVRLSKICRSQSSILKLKQKLYPLKIQRTDIKEKQSNEIKQQVNRISQQTKKPSTKKQQKIVKRNSHGQIKEELIKDKQNRNIQYQKWMSLSFYQRQQKVISNRKQKQIEGKKKQVEKQIKPCTFKPQLVGKSKSLKILQQQPQSYLQQYYGKLYRKY